MLKALRAAQAEPGGRRARGPRASEQASCRLRAGGGTAQAEPAREEFQGDGAAAGADALTAGKSAEPAPGREGARRAERERAGDRREGAGSRAARETGR